MPQGKQSVALVCDTCGLTSFWPRTMRRHRKTCGPESEAVHCGVCGENFSSAESLAQHKKSHAESEISYECNVCDKTFAHKRNLNAHLKTHQGEKLHACKRCDKRFSRKFNADRHEVDCFAISVQTIADPPLADDDTHVVDNIIEQVSQHLTQNPIEFVSADINSQAFAAASASFDILADATPSPSPSIDSIVSEVVIEVPQVENHEPRAIQRPRRLTRSLALAAEEEKIVNFWDDGLRVAHDDPVKGRGVFTTRKFARGEYITTYSGEWITAAEATERAKAYEREGEGNYLYFFRYQQRHWAFDATAEPPEGERPMHGRLINHAHSDDIDETRPELGPNVKPVLRVIGRRPYLVFVARIDIEENVELLYDYGDYEFKSWCRHPWLGPQWAQDDIAHQNQMGGFPDTQESYYSQLMDD